MNLLIKYPTRQRPAQFIETLAAYRTMLAKPEQTRFMVTVDQRDRTMTGNIPEGVELDIHPGQGKISAINNGTERSGDWDIVLLASDDMIPQVHGYDERIRQAMAMHYPDTDGALWIHDGRQDAICTIVCMGRAYFDRFGYIYHPSYKSLWCDNEWTEVAQALGKITKMDSIIRNESPDWGGNQKRDRLYLANNRFYRIDQRNYERRKALGFPHV